MKQPKRYQGKSTKDKTVKCGGQKKLKVLLKKKKELQGEHKFIP